MTEATESRPAPDTPSGFFGRLFDFSFEEFITLSIIKILYVLFVIAAGLAALGIFVAFASQGGATLVAGLIAAPIGFLLYVIMARVWLELLIVIFRIADNTAEIARQGRR